MVGYVAQNTEGAELQVSNAHSQSLKTPISQRKLCYRGYWINKEGFDR